MLVDGFGRDCQPKKKDFAVKKRLAVGAVLAAVLDALATASAASAGDSHLKPLDSGKEGCGEMEQHCASCGRSLEEVGGFFSTTVLPTKWVCRDCFSTRN